MLMIIVPNEGIMHIHDKHDFIKPFIPTFLNLGMVIRKTLNEMIIYTLSVLY